MADIPVDGKTRVAWVPTISNAAAPTVAELDAGILLQSTVTADGLAGFAPETAEVDAGSLASTFDEKSIGRASFSNTMLRLKKQTGTDTIYDTLVRGAEGYIVVRRYVDQATAWAASQKVSVFPVICGETKELDPEANTMARYEVPTIVRQAPTLRATTA